MDEYRNKRVNVSTSGEVDEGDAKNVAKVNESNNKKERKTVERKRTKRILKKNSCA